MNTINRTAIALAAIASVLLWPQIADATAVGRTLGDATVSPGGSARYSIPITVPPGVNDMTPELSLSYDHRQGEGIAGVGWGITGLSAITRCAKTQVQDGAPDGVKLETTDRYCLDGNQLRHTSGTYGASGSKYRTEVDMIARITANGTAGNGPAWFKVEAKNGLIYEYGNSADSRIESLATGKQTTARVWALNKMKDRAGNEVIFSYFEDGPPYGTYRVSGIAYARNSGVGGAADYTISFEYENQPAGDVDTSYATAGMVEDIKRLKRIKVSSNVSGFSIQVRKYDLTYEPSLSSADRSRLKSVQECAGIGTALDCFAPTQFSYQNGINSLASETSSGSTLPSGVKPLAIDINGDGRTDLVYPSAATGGSWMYRLANSSGGYSGVVNSTVSATNSNYAFAMDHNSDGRDDVMVPKSGGTWWVIHGTASGLSTSAINTGTSHNSNANEAIALDVSGDGREDLVWVHRITSPPTIATYVKVKYRNATGNGFGGDITLWTGTGSFNSVYGGTVGAFALVAQDRSRHFDVNGDGYKDIAFVNIYWPGFWQPLRYSLKFILGNNQGTQTVIVSGQPTAAYPIDLNGDGYTDIAYRAGTSSNLYTIISNGVNFGSIFLATSMANLDWSTAVVTDWSGDGMEDLLVNNTSSNTWYVAESDGFSLQSPANTWKASSSPIYAFATDSNGDGLSDVGYVKSNRVYAHRAHLGIKPDLLTDVVDALGNTVEFVYAALTDSGVYTKGSGAVFPMVDYLKPLYVVKSLEQSTGTGTTYSMDYKYEAARTHYHGRGLSGFEKRTTTDSRTGNKVIEIYHTDFPYRGRLKKREFRTSNNTLVQEATRTWAKKTAGSGYQNYHFPYVSNSVEKNFEFSTSSTYNGKQINTISTTSLVDSYGTPYDVTTTTTEHSNANGAMPGTSFTQRTYTPTSQLQNVTSTWCIGRRKQVTRVNSHSSTYGGGIWRTTDYTWDTSNNCRMTKEVVEPWSTGYKVTTDFEYDSFGNVKKQTVTGVNAGTNLPSRVTQIYWGVRGRFPETFTNPLGQVTTLNWDYHTGNLLSATDPNGLVTSWLYDGFNRQTRETAPEGTYTTFTFTNCTSANSFCGTSYSTVKTQIRTSSRNVTGYVIRDDDEFLDALDRTVQTANHLIDSSTAKTRTIYDISGRVWKRSSPTLTTSTLYYTENTFDALGRLTKVSRPIHDGTSAKQHSYIYYEGLKTRQKDAENNQTWKILDALGRVHQSHDSMAHYQQFDYDAFGSVKRIRDCVSSSCDTLTTMNYAYGADAFKTRSTDMSLGDWRYSFNSLGEMTAYNDAKTGGSLPGSKTASFTYDKLGRILTRWESEGTTTWTWGTSSSAKNIGRLASVSSPGHSQSFTYDYKGRLQRHRRVGGGTYDIDYTYDWSSGLLSSIQYPASTGGYRFRVLRQYSRGILKRVKRSDAGQTVYWEAQAQDAFGNIVEEDYANGATTLRGFDGVTGRIEFIQTDKGATELQNLAYSWDKVGNLLNRVDWRQTGYPTEDFVYDSLNRLTDADVSGAATSNLNVTYNPNGNIKKKDDVSSSNWVYHSSKKHAVATAGSNSYAYDANGNMTSRKGDSITWTSYNYPSDIREGARRYMYSYDANRQKWKEVYVNGSIGEVTYFAGRLFEKSYKASGTDYRHYIMANSRAVAMFVDRSSSADYTRYFTHDHLGSTDAIIHDNGTTSDVDESFDPFGERRDPEDWVGDPSVSDLNMITDRTDRGYTDHISLERSSLVHMNGRVYDAEIGRFLSPDPYVANPMNTQGFNRYAYVQNNPMRYTDPSGFCTEPLSGFICNAVIGTVLNFLFDGLFGGSSPPPPPDWCKDNTAGCGGIAAGNLFENISLDVYALPFDDGQEDDEESLTDEDLDIDGFWRRIAEEAEREYEQHKKMSQKGKEKVYGAKKVIVERDLEGLRRLAVIIRVGDDLEVTLEVLLSIAVRRPTRRQVEGLSRKITGEGPDLADGDFSDWIAVCEGKTGVNDGHCGFYDPNLEFHDVNDILPETFRTHP